jgi:hypothetical protein
MQKDSEVIYNQILWIALDKLQVGMLVFSLMVKTHKKIIKCYSWYCMG